MDFDRKRCIGVFDKRKHLVAVMPLLNGAEVDKVLLSRKVWEYYNNLHVNKKGAVNVIIEKECLIVQLEFEELQEDVELYWEIIPRLW